MMKQLATFVVALAFATVASAAHASRSKTPLKAEFSASQKRAAKVVRSPKSTHVDDSISSRSFGTLPRKGGSTHIFTNKKATYFQIEFRKPNQEQGVVGGQYIEFSKQVDGTITRMKRPAIQEVAGFDVIGAITFVESPDGTRRKIVRMSMQASDYDTPALSFEHSPKFGLEVSGPVTQGMKQNRKALLKAAEPYGSVMVTAARRALAD